MPQINYQIAEPEHALMQSPDLPFSVWCEEARRGGVCSPETGHLGDFGSFDEAEKTANGHPHVTVIKYFAPNEPRELPAGFREAYSVALKEGRTHR